MHNLIEQIFEFDCCENSVRKQFGFAFFFFLREYILMMVFVVEDRVMMFLFLCGGIQI